MYVGELLVYIVLDFFAIKQIAQLYIFCNKTNCSI